MKFSALLPAAMAAAVVFAEHVVELQLIEQYAAAFTQLIEPQTTLLVEEQQLIGLVWNQLEVGQLFGLVVERNLLEV